MSFGYRVGLEMETIRDPAATTVFFYRPLLPLGYGNGN
jgi:hypothetical protein